MAPPPAPPPRTSQTTDYYYFFVAFAAIAIMLLLSNIIAVGCCSPSRILQAIRTRVRRRTTMAGDPETSRSHEQQPQHHFIPLCKYSKGNDKDQQTQTECSVCLSLFIEGEELRQLPKCKHLFHAPCIDMWLFSHSNCPLCRADVFSEPARRSSRLRLLPIESRTDAAVVVFI